MSKADQAIALLDVVNGLRVLRDEAQAAELLGLVDELDRVKAFAGRELAAIADEHFMQVPAVPAAVVARLVR